MATDVTLRPVDPGLAHIQKLDVLVDGEVRGRIEQSRRDFTEGVADRWRDTMTVRREREGTRWEASRTGPGVEEDWWTYRSRKAAIEHVLRGPVGKVAVEVPQEGVPVSVEVTARGQRLIDRQARGE